MNYNINKINSFISELKKLYLSFGYNQVDINFDIVEVSDDKFLDINFKINEGKISKINKIYFIGNSSFNRRNLYENIKSRQKNILKFYTNSNYKSYIANSDIYRLKQFYLNKGFKNINIELKTEYISSNNKFNVYFYIEEGVKFFFNDININFEGINLTENQIDNLSLILEDNNDSLEKNEFTYNRLFTDKIKKLFSEYLFSEGLMFFEISVLEKVNKEMVDLLFQINEIKPKYVNNINISGNLRTQDKVIRRELEFAEGDAINPSLIAKSNKNINRLDLFKNLTISEKFLNDNTVDVDVKIEEKPTGDFNIGVAVGTLNGASVVTGLREKNIGGTGRNLDLAINSSDKNTKYSLNVIEPYILDKKLNLIYGISYTERDYSKSSSYKTNIFTSNFGFKYFFTEDITHSIKLNYDLKEYIVTNSSTVSSTIANSEGNNAEIRLINTLTRDKLNSFMRPTEGNLISYSNTYSPITNSDDGYLKNSLLYKKYYNFDNKIFSFQTKVGNIISLQNKNILPDDNFSLGGRWLRGFDSYGAGPRNSSTSYVGGHNLVVSKFDFITPLNKNSDNPIDLNIFTDVGKVWGNKTTPTNNSESIRSSYGFGIKFYSPIGPIGFSWAFPITDETYDIKRMFLFSIGNLN